MNDIFCLNAGVMLSMGAMLAAAYAQEQRQPISLRVQADEPIGILDPIWRFFGYDEPNYTYAPDGQRLLDEIAKLQPEPAHIRCHHLLTSGDGTPWLKWGSTGVYAEDAQGRPVYSFSILDRIFDTFRERGLKPYVQLGFMPEALSAKPAAYTPPKVLRGDPTGAVGGGAFQPPNDYGKWERFIETWARHCAERYGAAEAASWHWEVWNEPDIRYWQGTTEEYLRLYDHSAAAVKRALPGVRFGGPHVTNCTSENSERFLRRFLDHCLRGANAATGQVGAPLDFIAFHAKGGTRIDGGRVQMNLGHHLRVIDRGASIVASYPELRDRPIVIGESDPDGCAAYSARLMPQNGYRNGAHYASYTAATFLRKQAVAGRRGVRLEGALTWAFTFPDQPWFDGFRELATHGIVKPVFNAFRMFGQLDRQQVAVLNDQRRTLDDLIAHSVRKAPDVDGIATLGERKVTVLLWHYHDSGAPAPALPVQLSFDHLPEGVGRVRLRQWRIDDDHGNAFTAWKRMGSPQDPTPEQRRAMEDASEFRPAEPDRDLEVRDRSVAVGLVMPRQSVALVRVEW